MISLAWILSLECLVRHEELFQLLDFAKLPWSFALQPSLLLAFWSVFTRWFVWDRPHQRICVLSFCDAFQGVSCCKSCTSKPCMQIYRSLSSWRLLIPTILSLLSFLPLFPLRHPSFDFGRSHHLLWLFYLSQATRLVVSDASIETPSRLLHSHTFAQSSCNRPTFYRTYLSGAFPGLSENLSLLQSSLALSRASCPLLIASIDSASIWVF